jgi:hypothetical protein
MADKDGEIMVRMSLNVHDRLVNAKLIPREPLNDCIERLLNDNIKYKKVIDDAQKYKDIVENAEKYKKIIEEAEKYKLTS